MRLCRVLVLMAVHWLSGMGVGLFNGLMPDAMANNSQYTGIEYDTITGNIAKPFYPDSNIIVGDFTETKLPKNF